jgi:purine nucleosidase
VAGNVRIDKTSRNARLAREWAGREEVPVYAGAGEAAGAHADLCREHPWQGRLAGGGPCMSRRKGLAEGNAVQVSGRDAEESRASQHHYRHVGAADQPCALALVQAPEITQGIKEVVVMGGAHFNGGNITPVAEFNLFADPDAAEGGIGQWCETDVRAVGRHAQDPHQRSARLKQIAGR